MSDTSNNPLADVGLNTVSTAQVKPVVTSTTPRKIPLLTTSLIFALILSVVVNILQFQGLFPNNPTLHDNLPIDRANKNIKSFGTVYYFETTLRDLKQDSGKIELITDIEDYQIPRFIINQSTNIYAGNLDNLKVKTIEDLKVGQKIGIRVNYHNNSSPEITRITILP